MSLPQKLPISGHAAMRSASDNQPRPHPQRRGLAPLEFVLSLPLLLMMMAMIIVVGTAGAWKVRTLANSRQAAARALWPRDGEFDPHPANWWPDTATMRSHAAGPAPFNYDPFGDHYVVRGPLGPLQVDTDLLDVNVGMFAGEATIDRELPLWKQLPYRNHYERRMHVYSGDPVGIDTSQGGQWQFQPMRLGDNVSRRVDDLYPGYNLGAYGGLARTIAARDTLLAFPGTPPGQKLEVLDNDPELARRDFYPRVPWRTCTVDLQPVVDSLTDQIDGVPCALARAFCDYYRVQIMSGNPDPQLQQHVQELDQFLQSQCGLRCQ